jgi:hypothetical protein
MFELNIVPDLLFATNNLSRAYIKKEQRLTPQQREWHNTNSRKNNNHTTQPKRAILHNRNKPK